MSLNLYGKSAQALLNTKVFFSKVKMAKQFILRTFIYIPIFDHIVTCVVVVETVTIDETFYWYHVRLPMICQTIGVCMALGYLSRLFLFYQTQCSTAIQMNYKKIILLPLRYYCRKGSKQWFCFHQDIFLGCLIYL